MPTPLACIAEFCKECIYDPTEKGSWRQQVENCHMTKCPLYPVRPITLDSIYANRRAAESAKLIPNTNV